MNEQMADPQYEEPTGDWPDDNPSEYLAGWHAIQVEVTDPEPIGTLFVVTQAGEQQWTLVDREPITFGFCVQEKGHTP